MLQSVIMSVSCHMGFLYGCERIEDVDRHGIPALVKAYIG